MHIVIKTSKLPEYLYHRASRVRSKYFCGTINSKFQLERQHAFLPQAVHLREMKREISGHPSMQGLKKMGVGSGTLVAWSWERDFWR